jgi:hypothetical protein
VADAAIQENDAAEWQLLARSGDLAGAWHVSDRILERTRHSRDWTIPRHLQQIWDGSSFDGRRVLVRCYHGLGDTIQFVRYAPLLRAVAKEVIVWAQPALLPLLMRAPGIDRLLPLHDGAPDADYDVDIEIMELPYAFRTSLATIPAAVPYLSSDSIDLGKASPRVGVVWRGGEWDTRRWLPFDTVRALFDGTPVNWYSLQIDPLPQEHHPSLQSVDVQSIPKLAAAIASVDLVISVDSMASHLAGAMAVPVWTLLPVESDWRWMIDREDSPWYPTMRLFRQDETGWPRVIDRVLRDLQKIVSIGQNWTGHF